MMSDIYISKPYITINQYEKGDCCYATVDGHNSKGAYLKLDNGQRAFAYSAGGLQNGTKILCTIVKEADAERRALARLDSVCALYDDICA